MFDMEFGEFGERRGREAAGDWVSGLKGRNISGLVPSGNSQQFKTT